MRVDFILMFVLTGLGGCASITPADPFVGEFHFDLEPSSTSHKITKSGDKYQITACTNRKCDGLVEEATVLSPSDLAGWFQPDGRALALGVQAISVVGNSLVLFYVAQPDEKILARTKTHYLFKFWVFSGSATRLE
jgi:hypothetical protein